MAEHRLAVVIPFFKIDYFEETLQSLAEQTDQRFNVYISDDHSKNPPSLLLDEFRKRLNFTYKRFADNVGSFSLTRQWDRSVAMMKDECWFMILGDDDFLSANAVKEFYRRVDTAEDENITVIKLNSAVVNENNAIISQKKTEPLIKSAIEHFFDKYIYEGRSSLSEHIFKKLQYERYGFKEMPFAWHSDDLALLEFSEFGNIMFLENATCFVRVSSQSISGNPDSNKKEKWQATKIFFDYVCQHLNKFTMEEKKKLFDLIEWHEKEKNLKIHIPKKVFEFYSAYGYKGIIKTLK